MGRFGEEVSNRGASVVPNFSGESKQRCGDGGKARETAEGGRLRGSGIETAVTVLNALTCAHNTIRRQFKKWNQSRIDAAVRGS